RACCFKDCSSISLSIVVKITRSAGKKFIYVPEYTICSPVRTAKDGRFSNNLIGRGYKLRLDKYKSHWSYFVSNTQWLPLLAAVWRINILERYHSLNHADMLTALQSRCLLPLRSCPWLYPSPPWH